MTANSKIEWTDHTFNPWIGCQKVGPGCNHCYAEAQNARFGGDNWGPHAPRRRTSPKNWLEPLKWDKAAAAAGKPAFVFCASMADVFDNQADEATRAELWALMQDTPHLVWIIVTKRGANVASMIPDHWYKGEWPANIWLLYSICTQNEADRMVPLLLDQKAKYNIPVVGLSMEPMLEAVDITPYLYIYTKDDDAVLMTEEKPGDPLPELPYHHPATTDKSDITTPRLDWIIVGGESGRDARPMHPDWTRSLRDQCQDADAPFFFKQWGNCLPFDWSIGDTGPRSTGWVWDYDEGNCNVDPDDLGKASLVEAHGREFARFSHKHTGNRLDYKTHQARPNHKETANDAG